MYKTLFKETPKALILINKGKIIEVNNRACELYGYSEKEFLTLFFKDILSEYNEDDDLKKRCNICEIAFHRKNGGEIFPVDFSIKSVNLDGEECELVFIRDIEKCIDTHKYVNRLLKYKDALVVCSRILLKNGDLYKTLDKVMQNILSLSDFSRVYIFENFIEKGEIKSKLLLDKYKDFRYSKREDPLIYNFSYNSSPIMQTFISAPSFMQFTKTELKGSPEDIELLTRFDIQSIIIIPLYVNSKLFGFIGFDDCEKEIKYDATIVDILQILVKLVGFYLAKKIYEEHLHTTKEILEEMVTDRTKELIQKNTDLEGFAYSLSHDLQKPLANLDMLAHSIDKEELKDVPVNIKECIFRTHIEVHHGMDIINSLLKLFSISKENLYLQNNNLGNILREVYGFSYRRKSDLLINLEAEDIKVSCDKGLIKILFENLLSNSVKYRNNGLLKVKLSSNIVDGKEIYAYSDNGIGFNMEKAKDLFKPFVRVHEKSYPGNGIGLSLVKKIVEVHGGTIWVYSEKDKGTTFYFTLA